MAVPGCRCKRGTLGWKSRTGDDSIDLQLIERSLARFVLSGRGNLRSFRESAIDVLFEFDVADQNAVSRMTTWTRSKSFLYDVSGVYATLSSGTANAHRDSFGS